MRRSRRIRRLAVFAWVTGVVLLSASSTAQAELNGPCEATGAFTEGTDDGPFTVDAKAVGGDTVTVPRSDSVQWTGSVPGPPGDHSGSVVVDLPAPFGGFTVDSWAGSSQQTSNNGVEEYDLPVVVPSGVEFRVSGDHVDEASQCDGYVNVVIEGGPFTAPAVPAAALALTAIAAGGFFAAIKPIFGSAP